MTEQDLLPIQLHPLDGRDVSVILASLRTYQQTRAGERPPDVSEHFAEHTDLTDQEIDDLCERLNLN